MSQWDFPSDTDHMIMMTSFITISLRMLKNSIMSLAFSPIFPMQMPNAIKKPIRPVAENQKLTLDRAMAQRDHHTSMRAFTFTVKHIWFGHMVKIL